MVMKRILTGIKPSGELTLGNYIGAIKPMVDLQTQYDSYVFIADLHAITVRQDKELLKERIRKFAALYIACGIDPQNNIIYIQSENPYIPAISWLLECQTYYGEAARMIQFKEKSRAGSNFSVGLLTYPVLMAADILYADIDYVPVGIDQQQHVELARDIAERCNNIYGPIFTLPQPLIRDTAVKIKDLKNPDKKMSKSENDPMGVVSLFDDVEVIRKKIMKATTDSDNIVRYDVLNKPGISNLFNIVISMSDYQIGDIEERFIDKNYSEFKKFVADVVCSEIAKIQLKYKQLLTSNDLDVILDEGARQSVQLAEKKYCELRALMGLGRA